MAQENYNDTLFFGLNFFLVAKIIRNALRLWLDKTSPAWGSSLSLSILTSPAVNWNYDIYFIKRMCTSKRCMCFWTNKYELHIIQNALDANVQSVNTEYEEIRFWTLIRHLEVSRTKHTFIGSNNGHKHLHNRESIRPTRINHYFESVTTH